MIRRYPDEGRFRWRDISPELYSAAPDAMLRSPFSSGAIIAGRLEVILTKAKIHSSHDTDEQLCPITYQNETFESWCGITPGTDHLLVKTTDGGTYLFKFEGMVHFYGDKISMSLAITPLGGQFPFSKAAALLTDQSRTLIVYHQTNSLSIVEEIWDSNLDGWTNGTWIDYDK